MAFCPSFSFQVEFIPGLSSAIVLLEGKHRQSVLWTGYSSPMWRTFWNAWNEVQMTCIIVWAILGLLGQPHKIRDNTRLSWPFFRKSWILYPDITWDIWIQFFPKDNFRIIAGCQTMCRHLKARISPHLTWIYNTLVTYVFTWRA